MSYTAWEIILFLLFAFVLGFILGWIWFGRLFSGKTEADNNSASDKISSDADLEACRAKCAKTEAELATAHARIAQLQGDLDAAASAPKKQTFTTSAPKPSAFSGDALEAAKANPDDLKLIKGVGPIMEKVLNEHGCYTFEQVANLSDQDVEWVAANINTFPDRITRDKWVEQAKKLAAEK